MILSGDIGGTNARLAYYLGRSVRRNTECSKVNAKG
jgi:hypothetical protein